MVQITSKNGRVTITADDSSSVSGVSIDGERVFVEEQTKPYSIMRACILLTLGFFLGHLVLYFMR